MILLLHRRLALTIVGLCLLIGFVATRPGHAVDADSYLQSIRSRLPFVSTHDFLYRREPRDVTRDKDKVAAAFRVLMELESSELSVPDLVRLTVHAEPDIRVLALLGLVAQESREVIPACMRLVDDSALTLPLQLDRRSFPLRPDQGSVAKPEYRVATEPQKVAHVARRILKMVGCPLPYDHSPRTGKLTRANTDEVNQWWSARKDNPDWLKWFEFLYQRASQGTWPVLAAAEGRIARFRRLADALPAETRAWLLLYLADDVLSMDGEWHSYYASMEEMIDAAKVLGPEKLIAFLKDGQRRGLSDPELDDTRKGQRFVIRNAIDLFQKEHARALLELKHFTAATDADPTSVRRLANAGMSRLKSSHQSWERGKLMAALAVHGKEADRQTATKWFYAEANRDGGSSAQSVFIGALRHRRPDNWREIIRPIVAHQDFEQLKPLDVIYLALLVQKLGDLSFLDRPIYHDDSTRLRNELRRLVNIEVVESKTLTVPTTVLKRPVWSRDLLLRAHSLAVSEDGRWLAVGMGNSKPAVYVLDAQAGTVLNGFDEPSGQAFRVEFVSSRKLVFAPRNDNLTGNLLTWTVGEGVHQPVSINPERDRIHNTRPEIVPSRRDGKLALLDTRTLGWFQDSKVIWGYEKRSRAPTQFAVSDDAQWIAFNDGFRQPIELISTQDGRVRHVLTGLSTVPSRMSFSPDSKRLMALGGDDRLIVWNTATGREVTRYLGLNTRFGPLNFSVDGSSFIANAGPGHIGSYSTADGTPQFSFPFRVRGGPYDANSVSAVLFSRDGRHLYALLVVAEHGSGQTVWNTRIQKWNVPDSTPK